MKKFKKKSDLSRYSTMIGLSIEEYTKVIRDEICFYLDTRGAVDDPNIILTALNAYQGVVSHLVSEYRIIKDMYQYELIEFDKIEISALNFARTELSVKSTEKQIKLLAYEQQGDVIHTRRGTVEKLEGKMKVIRDQIDVARTAISATQSAANIMKLEWESGKVM